MRRVLVLATLALCALAQPPARPLRFVLMGDRTGEAQPGVWEQVWKEVAAAKPSFVVCAGDLIQGLNDATAESEWREEQRTVPRAIPFYPAPGNHDVWSELSARLFAQYTHHPLHYSFDRGPAHFTVLDTSRSDQLPADEFAFLESDLQEHAAQPVKFIVSHRPFWLLEALFHNTRSPVQELAKKYGVRYIVAGHIHQLAHVDVDGVTYVSLPSAGGHLRASEKYADGWLFGYTLVTVNGGEAAFEVHELGAPHGQGRTSVLSEWGVNGRK